MKTFSLFSIFLAGTLVAGPALAQTNASGTSEAKLLQTLKKAYPSTQFTSAQRSAVPGIYEVVMGQNIAYVDESGRYFLIGRMIDMLEKTDITAATKERIAQRVEWSDLPLNDAIQFGKGEKRLAVFSDPDCPFCRQLEGELEKLDDVAVYVFPYPIASLHPSAARTSQAIWCSPNRTKAWRDYLMRKVAPPPAPSGCDATAIARNVALAERLSITATPTLISGDGRIASGASKAEQILAWIERGSAK